MPASAGWVRRGTVMISDKICPQHLERKAILYVRQSSAHQVLHNRESSALQYAMRDRLTTLGWSEIEVIDDDLGRSAAGGVQRAGFERMVAQVCLGKVGAVAAREVSRHGASDSYSAARFRLEPRGAFSNALNFCRSAIAALVAERVQPSLM